MCRAGHTHTHAHTEEGRTSVCVCVFPVNFETKLRMIYPTRRFLVLAPCTPLLEAMGARGKWCGTRVRPQVLASERKNWFFHHAFSFGAFCKKKVQMRRPSMARVCDRCRGRSQKKRPFLISPAGTLLHLKKGCAYSLFRLEGAVSRRRCGERQGRTNHALDRRILTMLFIALVWFCVSCSPLHASPFWGIDIHHILSMTVNGG